MAVIFVIYLVLFCCCCGFGLCHAWWHRLQTAQMELKLALFISVMLTPLAHNPNTAVNFKHFLFSRTRTQTHSHIILFLLVRKVSREHEKKKKWKAFRLNECKREREKRRKILFGHSSLAIHLVSLLFYEPLQSDEKTQNKKKYWIFLSLVDWNVVTIRFLLPDIRSLKWNEMKTLLCLVVMLMFIGLFDSAFETTLNRNKKQRI